MYIYSSTIFSIRIFSLTYFFLDLGNLCPHLHFPNAISVLLCSMRIFRISFGMEGCTMLIPISKTRCQPSTELLVLGKVCSTRSLTFQRSIKNKAEVFFRDVPFQFTSFHNNEENRLAHLLIH